MRKGLLLLLLMCLIMPARAEEATPEALWFAQTKAELVPMGVEAAFVEHTYALSLPDDVQALSLCLTATGDLRFGRYAQLVRTGLIDAQTGEALPITRVFADVDALQAYLDDYVEQNVQDTLNTYLDVGDLLPVPLDAVCFDAQGVTFHYPSERFMFFSQNSGAVQLMWYELEDQLAIAPPQTAGVAELADALLEEACDSAVAQYGALTEPDLYAGGEIYEFENPALRGIAALAGADGTINTLRCMRFDWQGVRPGMKAAAVREALGVQDAAVILDDEAAALYRLRAGSMLRGTAGAYQLAYYFDGDEVLYALEISR